MSKITVECDSCGKIIRREATEVRRSKHHFCNRKCQGEWHSEHSRGKNNTNWKGDKIEITCDACGEIIETRYCTVKSHKHNFCNRKCKNKWLSAHQRGNKHPCWKGGKIEITCDNCGRIIEKKRYEIKKSKHHFCDGKCHAQWRSEHEGSEKSPIWKGGKKRVNCDNCGRPIKQIPSQIERSKHHFCNLACLDQWRSEDEGKNSPSWKGGKIKITCDNCGNPIERVPCEVKKRKHHFCNQKCKKEWQIEHHKKIGKIEKPTKPERIFKEICEKNNLPYRYVGDGKLWIGKKGGKKLNPDFIECNGKKIVVEIMGNYWHSPLLNPMLREGAMLSYREKHFKHFGWKSIFFWETDILRKDAEIFVLGRLKKENIYNPDR